MKSVLVFKMGLHFVSFCTSWFYRGKKIIWPEKKEKNPLLVKEQPLDLYWLCFVAALVYVLIRNLVVSVTFQLIWGITVYLFPSKFMNLEKYSSSCIVYFLRAENVAVHHYDLLKTWCCFGHCSALWSVDKDSNLCSQETLWIIEHAFFFSLIFFFSPSYSLSHSDKNTMLQCQKFWSCLSRVCLLEC